ncbi:metallophosphoesterase [Paenibacillus polysaccharolyticus]|uniref:metallophosphoesterase family protein n=1 Tax=Paenibacillus polysaccharolyticus TaxID=582692 RepID=UPI002041AC75|nr:metallophosphoesterase family protein [Paenibacillus polysaccharolyticus]MCM3134306.1 metallophosphoesterase [Paenibacillus polysaccharolyticus]
MSTTEQPLATFQVITDTHVRDEADHIHNRHLEQALADIASFSDRSSGIMHVGDVTDRGLPSEYREWQRIWEQYAEKLPEIRFTVGNHDIGAVIWQKPPLVLLEMTEGHVAKLLEQDAELEHPVKQTAEESAALIQKLAGNQFMLSGQAGHGGEVGSSEGSVDGSEGGNTEGSVRGEVQAEISARTNAETITVADLWHRRLIDFEAATGMKGSYHDHWIDGYHYIFLGTEQPHPKDCEMSSKQLEWLDEKLAEQAALDRPIFLFIHQPLMDTVAGSLQAQGWYGVNQDAELKAVLAKYPQAILFSGHTHWQLQAPHTMYDGAGQLPTMFNASSVAYLWTDEDEHLEGSEGLHVEIYKDRVIVKGRDFAAGKWVEGAEYTVRYPVAVS